MLSADVERYLEMRRASGCKFLSPAYPLRNFAAFAEACGDAVVHTSRVLEWAILAPSLSQRRLRLLIVRRFALMMRAEDNRHEVPAADALGRAHFSRPLPYIYSPEEITRLINAAARMGPPGSIRPLTYATLFGLLAATGLRISEALALRIQDITEDALIVRETKFNKSRMVFLHDTVIKALYAYLSTRSNLGVLEDTLFISTEGRALTNRIVDYTFLRLAQSIGLRGEPGQPGPRVHDLRHTFAVRSLEHCPHDRDAVFRHAAALATYLGHSRIEHTYWYLEATPVLLKQIAAAGEAQYLGGSP